MYRVLISPRKLRKFLVKVTLATGMKSTGIAIMAGVCSRTLRDWGRGKYYPNEEALIKLGQLSGVPLPKYKKASQYWYIAKAARLGGIRRMLLYGPPGTPDGRSKGGKVSWLKRKGNLDLWKKYTNSFKNPRESRYLAEFVGIMLGDGNLSEYQCTVYLNSETDKEYAMYVKKLIIRLFGSEPAIYKSRKAKMLRVVLSGVNLIKILKSKGLLVGNKIKLGSQVPEWVYSKPEYIKACIRGLIDTDGCFAIHRYKVRSKKYVYIKICFSNKARPLLDYVYEELRKLGYSPKRFLNLKIWLYNQSEVRRYLQEIGTRNRKLGVRMLERGPDGKAAVC